jgi:sporulation protein YlmC with PRC-barrel domain
MSDYSDRGGVRGNDDVERDETADLISSEKVEGTTVYSRDGEDLGTIHSLMIGKQDGKVAYAVVSFGGFLGLGSSHFPVPWSQLHYSREYDGYVTNLTEDRLRNAPNYSAGTESTWYGSDWRSRVDSYYV